MDNYICLKQKKNLRKLRFRLLYKIDYSTRGKLTILIKNITNRCIGFYNIDSKSIYVYEIGIENSKIIRKHMTYDVYKTKFRL